MDMPKSFLEPAGESSGSCSSEHSAAASPRTQPELKPQCIRCGQEGHWSSNCTLNESATNIKTSHANETSTENSGHQSRAHSRSPLKHPDTSTADTKRPAESGGTNNNRSSINRPDTKYRSTPTQGSTTVEGNVSSEKLSPPMQPAPTPFAASIETINSTSTRPSGDPLHHERRGEAMNGTGEEGNEGDGSSEAKKRKAVGLTFATKSGKNVIKKFIDKSPELAREHRLREKAHTVKAGLSAVTTRFQSSVQEIDQKYDLADRARSGYIAAKKEAKKTAKQLSEILSNAVASVNADEPGDKSTHRHRLGGQLKSFSSEVVRRVRQAHGIQRTIVRRVDNIKNRVKSVLSSEIREGTLEAYEMTKGGGIDEHVDIATAVPALVAPVLLAMLRNHYTANLYIMIPESIVTLAFLIADANNTCRYDVEEYFSARLVLNVVMITCIAILRYRLNRWYTRNGNSWEANLESAKNLLAEDSLDENFAVATMASGLATLMFYDKLKSKCSYIILYWFLTPFLLFYNWLVLYLAFSWGCADCEKDLLQVWMILMACMYLVTFVLQFSMAALWLTELCVKCNPLCKPCILRVAAYFDEDLPHPICKWSAVYVLFRRSSNTLFQRKLRRKHRERRKLQNQKTDLEKKLRRINAKLEYEDSVSNEKKPQFDTEKFGVDETWQTTKKAFNEAIRNAKKTARENSLHVDSTAAASAFHGRAVSRSPRTPSRTRNHASNEDQKHSKMFSMSDAVKLSAAHSPSMSVVHSGRASAANRPLRNTALTDSAGLEDGEQYIDAMNRSATKIRISNQRSKEELPELEEKRVPI